jgi:hypothetical protein
MRSQFDSEVNDRDFDGGWGSGGGAAGAALSGEALKLSSTAVSALSDLM